MKPVLHAPVGFRNPVGALEDQGLRGMKLRIIGKVPPLPGNVDRQNGLSVLKRFRSTGKIRGSFGLHRSTPSLRISCISGEEGSRQLSAG